MNKYNVRDNVLAGIIVGSVVTFSIDLINKQFGIYEDNDWYEDEAKKAEDRLSRARTERDTLLSENTNSDIL